MAMTRQLLRMRVPTSSARMLQLQRATYRPKTSSIETRSLLRPCIQQRWKSSMPQYMHDEEAGQDAPVRRLQVADWADRARTMPPRSKLQPQSSDLVFTEELGSIEKVSKPARNGMTKEEVDEWLAEYEIPEQELAKCKTQDEIDHVRELYARQLRLECSIYEMAMEKREMATNRMKEIGRSSESAPGQRLIRSWMEPARDFIANEQKRIKNGLRSTDSNVYGAALMLLPPDIIAATAMNVMLNLCLTEPNGVKFIKLALGMGKAVQDEIIVKKEAAAKRNVVARNLQGEDPSERHYLAMTRNMENDKLIKKMYEYNEDVGGWDKRISLKVGAAIIDCIQRSCFVPSSGDKKELAFEHDYVFERNRRSGIIKIHPEVPAMILGRSVGRNVLPWTARYLPMLVPPKHWDGVVNGGYLKLHTKVMRQRDQAWQMDCVKRGHMPQLYRALNALAEVPWVVNKDVLNVVLQVWEDGGGFGDLPTRTNMPQPEWKDEYANDPVKREAFDKRQKKVQQHNAELHSLRCDTLYKLQVAEEFQDEEAIYYPYNIDFRGRVYPVPPNLNHLGSDLSRSLLIFRDRKPLGEQGLRWLKIHLANVFGVDKCSFDERVQFAEESMHKVKQAAENPLGNDEYSRWWQEADYPFLALGVCFELKRAMESPDPTKYESNIPVHQDGSCNGLQHYAALGRDKLGGEQVNLVPGERPGDVYAGVARQVVEKVERDANIELPFDGPPPKAEKITELDTEEEKERKRKDKELLDLYNKKEAANFLLGTITRKVVKQTVMTSVYGVTYIGARKQIMARLEEVFLDKDELLDQEMEQKIYQAACYAADLTMQSMGDLFTSARGIMAWLGDCAAKVAQNGQAMSWVTPLGLPVVQPYKRNSSLQIRTKVQNVLLVLSEQLPVANGRQKSAFPPNYVHSLDSTHMLLTALRCLDEDKITFAAVHDSYWTHAADVDTMNERLREEFVELYSQPLLENLLEELELRFPETKFKPIPPLGTLDLEAVKDSPYFFN